MSGITRILAKELSSALGITNKARPALRMTDQPPKVSYDTYGEAAGANVASFYSPSVELLKELDIPKKGLLGRDALIALDKDPDTRIAEIETITPLLDANKRYTREELADLLEANTFKVKALRNPSLFDEDTYEYYDIQRQKDMILDPEFEELDYQESIIVAERTNPEALSKYGTFEASQGQHFTDDTLAHWRHSIQKDTRNNDKYYFVEEMQSDLISKTPVPSRLYFSTAEEGLKHRIEGKLQPMEKTIFKNVPGFYDNNKDFYLDYAAAYAELSGDKTTTLNGAFDSLNKKYNLNVKRLKPEDVKIATWETLPRVPYKGTPEALEKARVILGKPELSGDELLNDVIVRYFYDDYGRSFEQDDFFEKIFDDYTFREALNYGEDLDKLQEKYDLVSMVNGDTPDKIANKTLKNDVNKQAKEYLLRKALNNYSNIKSPKESITRSLQYVQSNAMDYASYTEGQLIAPISAAPIKKLEEVTKIILQAAIKDAAANGISKIVIPNIERIAALREKPGTDAFKAMVKNGSSFYKMYVKGLEKALKDIKKSLPEIKVYQDEIPYGRTVKVKDPDFVYRGDAITLIKVRRELEANAEGASLGENGRPITGKELISKLIEYSNSDWEDVPKPYRDIVERLDYDRDLRVGLGLPEDDQAFLAATQGNSYTTKKTQFDDLRKDATFIDIEPYINKDFVLRFNKGGLVERRTK
jgi:hypothetical protein